MVDENKKFFFNLNNFDVDHEEEKKKPKEPTFSLQDMEEARTTAFEKGKAEGTQIAKDSIEQRTEILVQSIAGNMTTLEQREAERQQHAIQDSLAITYKTLEALIPSLWDKIAEQDIKRFLNDFFAQTVSRNGFLLFVHPSMEDAITPYVEKLHTDLKIITDEQLTPNSSRIEWDKGHATFTPEKTAEQILAFILEQIDIPLELLDESTKNPHNEEKNKELKDSPSNE